MEGYKPGYCGSFIGKGRFMENEEVAECLSRVVSCSSVFGNEGNCGRLLKIIARENGLKVETVSVPNAEDRFNVMITEGADSYLEKPLGLLLHGHYDTVPVLDMQNPFDTTVKDNVMCGRGIVDQKSGLVAALCAAIAIKRAGIRLKKPLCVAAVVDEESEHRGSYTLAQSGLKAEYAITTEPTDTYTCQFGCKGTTPIRIRVKGKTAHAGTPWVGVNAIEKSMPILDGLMKMKFPETDLGELGIKQGTLCVSVMNAGTAYNNVPGMAEIWIDRRTVPGENTELALSQVHEVIENAKKQDSGLEAEADIARPDWHWDTIRKHGLNPTLVPTDCKLYDYLNSAAQKAGLGTLKKGFFNGYNDMDFLVNDLGIPTLVFGPGDGTLCHTAHERVNLDQVCQVTETMCHLIQALCAEE